MDKVAQVVVYGAAAGFYICAGWMVFQIGKAIKAEVASKTTFDKEVAEKVAEMREGDAPVDAEAVPAC